LLTVCQTAVGAESRTSSVPLSRPPSNAQAIGGDTLNLTETELYQIIADAIDEAVDLAVQEAIATERPAREAAEKARDAALDALLAETARADKAERGRRALLDGLPWAAAGGVLLVSAAFVAGVWIGAK
jgi:hypothetical protein